MNSKFTIKNILISALLVFLAGCQGFNGLSKPGSPQGNLLPLTSDHASAAGASALVLQQNPSNDQYTLVPINVGTGKPVDGFSPIEFGLSSAYAFSTDREHMAFAASSSLSCPTTCLHVLNLRTWKEDIQPVLLPNSFADSIKLAFDQSGKIIAVFIDSNTGNGGQLLLVDLTQAKIVQKTDLSSSVLQMVFTPEDTLALYGNLTSQPGKTTTMYVTLFDNPSLQVRWHQDLAMVSYGSESSLAVTDPSQGFYLNPAAVFSANAARLYIVAADEPRLVTIDFADQNVKSADIQPPKSLLERLLDGTASVVYAKLLNGTTKSAALSADGKHLYVVGQTTTAVKNKDGNWEMQTIPLGMQVVDVGDGTELARLATSAYSVNVSIDGKTILLNGTDNPSSGYPQPWTDLVDTATYKVTGRINSELLPSRLLDGSLAWLSSTWSDTGDAHLAIYNSGSQSPVSKLDDSANKYSYWVPIP